MSDPISKLFDPAAGDLTPEEERSLCETLSRLQREADEDGQSPRLQSLIKAVDQIVSTSSPDISGAAQA
jgi:hypothetical protein